MQAERPDLSEVPEAVRAYVEALEAELARLRAPAPPSTTADALSARSGEL